jgi:hypothetical protein
MAIGWQWVETYLGVVITGNRSVRYRIISNDMLPCQMMIPARNSMIGTPLVRKISPTTWLDSRCGDKVISHSSNPPR